MTTTDVPFGEAAEGRIKGATADGARSIFAIFKSGIGIATEPFFRKEMGERYLSPTGVAAGCLVWGVAILGSLLVKTFGALKAQTAQSLYGFGAHKTESILKNPDLWIAGGIPFVLVGLFILICKANAAWVFQTREDRELYHSRSPGKRRWGPGGTLLIYGTIIGIGYFSPVTCAIILLSRLSVIGMEADQYSAIWSAYLDKHDSKCETMYLKDALLGKCPPERTYLYGPLPATYSKGLLTDIAEAAAVEPPSVTPKKSRAGAPGGFVQTPAVVSPTEKAQVEKGEQRPVAPSPATETQHSNGGGEAGAPGKQPAEKSPQELTESIATQSGGIHLKFNKEFFDKELPDVPKTITKEALESSSAAQLVLKQAASLSESDPGPEMLHTLAAKKVQQQIDEATEPVKEVSAKSKKGKRNRPKSPPAGSAGGSGKLIVGIFVGVAATLGLLFLFPYKPGMKQQAAHFEPQATQSNQEPATALSQPVGLLLEEKPAATTFKNDVETRLAKNTAEIGKLGFLKRRTLLEYNKALSKEFEDLLQQQDFVFAIPLQLTNSPQNAPEGTEELRSRISKELEKLKYARAVFQFRLKDLETKTAAAVGSF